MRITAAARVGAGAPVARRTCHILALCDALSSGRQLLFAGGLTGMLGGFRLAGNWWDAADDESG